MSDLEVPQATAAQVAAAQKMAKDLAKQLGMRVSGPGYGSEWALPGQSPKREQVGDPAEMNDPVKPACRL